MRRSIVTAAATLAFFVGTANLPMASAYAGSTTTKPTSGTGRFEKLKTALEQMNLSATQKTQIQQIMTATKTQLKAAKGVSATGTAGKTNVKEIVAGAVKKIVAVLTPQQKAKLKGLMGSEKV